MSDKIIVVHALPKRTPLPKERRPQRPLPVVDIDSSQEGADANSPYSSALRERCCTDLVDNADFILRKLFFRATAAYFRFWKETKYDELDRALRDLSDWQ